MRGHPSADTTRAILIEVIRQIRRDLDQVNRQLADHEQRLTHPEAAIRNSSINSGRGTGEQPPPIKPPS